MHNAINDLRGDTGIIRLTDPYFTAVGGYAAMIAAWTVNVALPVGGVGRSYLGEFACHYGLTNPRRCGTVDLVNTTISVGGILHQNMTHTNGCANGGDSGGPWVDGNIALGVHSGSAQCPNPGATYMEAIEAASKLGVRIATN